MKKFSILLVVFVLFFSFGFSKEDKADEGFKSIDKLTNPGGYKLVSVRHADIIRGYKFNNEEDILKFITDNMPKSLEEWKTRDLTKKNVIFFLKHKFELPPGIEKLDGFKKKKDEVIKKIAETELYVTKLENELIELKEYTEMNELERVKAIKGYENYIEQLRDVGEDSDKRIKLIEELSKIKDFIKMDYLARIKKIGQYEAEIKKLKETKEDLKREEKKLGEVIIITENQEIKEIDDEVEFRVLHKEKGKWSNHLVNTKKILVVLLGGDDTLAKSKIKIVKQTSAFKKSFEEVKELWRKLREEEKEKVKEKAQVEGIGPPMMSCRFYELKSKKIRTPCEMTIKPVKVKNEFRVEIHEKNWALLRLGVGRSLIDKKYIKIEDKKLKVMPDEEGKKEWKDNLMLLFNLHIPREPGKLKVWDRLGIFVGVKFSTDFLETIAGGLSITLFDDIDLIGGFSFNNEMATDTEGIQIGDIDSFADLKDFVNRKYSKGRWFFGLAFSPAAITKALFK